MKSPLHIVLIIANCTTVPYFRWFAQESYERKEKRVNFSFILLSKEKPILTEEISAYGNNVHWVYFDDENRKKSMIKAYFSLRKIFKNIKPNIVNTQLFDDSLPALLAAKHIGIKTRIITKSDTSFHHFYAPKGVKWDNFNNANATHVVAISSENKNFIQQFEKNWENKLQMIHHGIQTEIYRHPNFEYVKEFKEKWKLGNKFLVGTVSRFIEWKGYREIVKAAEIVIAEIPEICFLLIGHGPQKEEIKDLIKERKLEKYFCMPGYIQPVNMPSVYSTMNVYLHAAHFEPFGFVIAEALATGLPVISTPTGAAKDAIIHEKNGWLSEYKNPQQLAKYIFEVYQKNISIPWQPALEAAEMNYEFKKMYDAYTQLYCRSY